MDYEREIVYDLSTALATESWFTELCDDLVTGSKA